MRAGAGLTATELVVPAAARGGGRSPEWHSPVPYLFGGLAAMLGLITFALLLLACSYWKLAGHLQEGRADADADAEAADPKAGAAAAVPVACYEEKFVVIMAGDEKPTYLATPISSPASSFGDRSSNDTTDGGDDEKKKERDEANGEDRT